MKHYRLNIKMFAEDGHIIDRQAIEFVPSDCRHKGKLIKEAAPNKRIIFCTFIALVETCIESAYEGDCSHWELQAVESDTASGQMRFIKFEGTTSEIFVRRDDGIRTECGSKYDEYFDYWLF